MSSTFTSQKLLLYLAFPLVSCRDFIIFVSRGTIRPALYFRSKTRGSVYSLVRPFSSHIATSRYAIPFDNISNILIVY